MQRLSILAASVAVCSALTLNQDGARSVPEFPLRRPGQEPAHPKVPGCYVWMPTACPRQKFHAQTMWRHIPFDNETACARDAKKKYDDWCGGNDAKMLWVPRAPTAPTEPPEAPQQPGCYVWMPSGCPAASQPLRADLQEFARGLRISEWKRDVWGEVNQKAGVSKEACEGKRKSKYDTWCGTTDAKMIFVPGQEPAHPEVPGCYVWMPTACPRQKFHAKTTWRHIPFDNETACATDGKKKYDDWCGGNDAKTLWVPRAPKAPKEPGCYVWMPTGCTNHPFHVRQQWKRDAWGEENARAAADRTACESQRKSQVNAWCGTSNAKMLYVDGPAPVQPFSAQPASTGLPADSDEAPNGRRYG